MFVLITAVFYHYKKYLFIWLCQVLVVACSFSYGIWDLVP